MPDVSVTVEMIDKISRKGIKYRPLDVLDYTYSMVRGKSEDIVEIEVEAGDLSEIKRMVES